MNPNIDFTLEEAYGFEDALDALDEYIKYQEEITVAEDFDPE